MRFPRAILLLLAVPLFAILIAGPVAAQGATSDEREELERIKEERERLQKEDAEKALEVDIAQDGADDVLEALDAVNALVATQQAELTNLEQAAESARLDVDRAVERLDALRAEIEAIEEDVADLAISTFIGDGGSSTQDLTSFLTNEDPSEAARLRSLVEFRTGNLADSIEQVKGLKADAEVFEQQQIDALEQARALEAEAADQLTELEEAQAWQDEVLDAAESRLEARLAEASFISELDSDLAAEESVINERIARRIAAAEAARRRPTSASSSIPIQSAADMEWAEGFLVNKSVVGQVGEMIRAARADGVTLSGYGWRSPERTAQLRLINGCPDVYDSPASSCRIPTARPGQSMHERGLAIDFASCSRSSSCFRWLSSNAASYSFFNLPSESWHWSTNGN